MALGNALKRIFLPGLGDPAEQRTKEWNDLVKSNPRVAPTAEDYNAGLDFYQKFRRLPPTRNQEVRAEAPGGVQEVPGPEGGLPIRVMPETSVAQKQVPIRMGRPGYRLNQDTGALEEVDDAVMSGGSNVLRYNPTAPKQAPGAMEVQTFSVPDPITGEMRKMSVMTQGGKPIRVITPPQPAKGRGSHSGGGGGRTAQEADDLNALAAFRRANQTKYDWQGNPLPLSISPDIEMQALSAAKRLKLPMHYDNEGARWVIGEEMPSPGAPPASIVPPPSGNPAMQSGGKQLTPELAKALVQEAGGDKDKARALAKQRGYSF